MGNCYTKKVFSETSETPKSGFQLLELPDLPLRKVVNFMSPVKLWILAQESLCFNILIRRLKLKVTNLEAHGFVIATDFESRVLDRFETMKEKKWRALLTEYSNFWKAPYTRLTMETEDFKRTWEWIIKDHNKLKYLNLTVMDEKRPREVIRKLLKNSNLKNLKHLNIRIESSKTFDFPDPFTFENPPRILYIIDSSWFSVQNLIDSRVQECLLWDSGISDMDLNFFLKNWIADASFSAKLRKLTVYKKDNQEFKSDIVFDGLWIERERNSKYSLRRRNGIFALIELNGNMFRFKTNPLED